MSILYHLLDYIILFMIAVYALQGVRHGTLVSLASTASMGASWLIAGALAPTLSAAVSHTGAFSFMQYLTQTSADVSTVELYNTSVSSITSTQITDLVAGAKLPPLYAQALSENLTDQAFSGTMTTTVSQYLDQTIANVTQNLVSFLLIYLLCRVIFCLIISSWNFSAPFAVLTRYDGLVGGILGGVRGVLAAFALTMLVPAMLVMVDFPEIQKFVTDTALGNFFYEHNFLFGFISGIF